jgi:hypothetical protein
MNLPDAPIPHEGFFGTHCFAVIDATIEGLYVRSLGGKLIQPDDSHVEPPTHIADT